jgi:TolB-like protein
VILVAALGVLASSAAVAQDAALQRAVVAVLPVENLSGAPAPLTDIHEQLRGSLRRAGIRLLSDPMLEEFMTRHRLRYVGGLPEGLARALGEETGAAAALVTSVDLYDEALSPKFGLIARLVSTGPDPAILWMDDTQFAGHQKPGVLGMGLVEDVRVLQERALRRIADSLSRRVREGTGATRRGGGRGQKPKQFFGSPFSLPEDGRPLRIAVLPFSNDSDSPRAGEILALQFVRHLTRIDGLTVIEPGVVRQALLQGRLVREGGVSLPQADLLRAMVRADVVLSGVVRDYQENRGAWGVPFVNFSARAIDTRTQQSVWSSMSFNRGDAGVVFFDAGRLHTAHALAAEMVRGVVQTADRRSRKKRR